MSYLFDMQMFQNKQELDTWCRSTYILSAMHDAFLMRKYYVNFSNFDNMSLTFIIN